MTLHPIARLFAVSTVLLCVACGEKTVVREVPVNAGGGVVPGATPGAAPTTPAFGDPAAPGVAPVAPAVPSLGDGLEDLPDVALEPVLVDPETVSGVPGQIVDCAFTVPCRWLDADNGFAVTLTSADDVGSIGGLKVAFAVSATHDTEVSYGGGSTALGADGRRLSPTVRTLGPGDGNAPMGLLAGETLSGGIDHAQPADKQSLARFALALTDNGFVREAIFVNIPVGPAASASVDCAMDLPCTWQSADSRASVSLISAGGIDSTGNLTTGFSITTATDSAVALDGATAIGRDGTRFVARTHTLGTESGFDEITATTVAALPLAATVKFNRTATRPAALSRLVLDLYPDAPVPRWSIVFENVPLP